MTLFQSFAAVFGLCMMYIISIHKRKSQLGVIETSFWYSTWSVFVIIALFPNLLLGLSISLKFSRVFDLLVVVAFMVLAVVSIMNYLSLRETRSKLEETVRKEAIRNAGKKSKKS